MTLRHPETKEDLANELEVIKVIAGMWGCEFQKLPMIYSADYALLRDKEVRAWVEIKCRKVSSSTYPSLLLSYNKVLKCLSLAKLHNGMFFIVVRFTDCIKYLCVDADDLRTYKVVIGGRTDRDDPDDIEPMVELPLKLFKEAKCATQTAPTK